jgi:Na+/phosphate symporter
VYCLHPSSRNAAGFVYLRLLTFLIAFAGLLIFVSYYYLFPAMEAFAQTTTTAPQKRVLAAHAALVLALLLFVLLVGLLLSLRMGRFFFPARRQRAKPTHYPDAWAEAGRRIEVEPREEEQ